MPLCTFTQSRPSAAAGLGPLSLVQASHVLDNEIGARVIQGLYLKNNLLSIIFGQPVFNVAALFSGFKDSMARLKNRSPWIADAARGYNVPLAHLAIACGCNCPLCPGKGAGDFGEYSDGLSVRAKVLSEWRRAVTAYDVSIRITADDRTILDIRKTLQHAYRIRSESDQVSENPLLIDADSFNVSKGCVKSETVSMDVSE